MAGEMDKAKGAVKETYGKATGDTRTEAEGKVDKMKGQAKDMAQKAQDGAHDMAQKAKDSAQGARDSLNKG